MRLLISFVAIFATCKAVGHGETKPGPHNGFIRMPGAFHTEIVPLSKSEFQLYLLDFNWANPTIRKSMVDVKIESKKGKVPVRCTPNVDHFKCELPNGFDLKKGKLILNSSREDTPGAEITYDLPLKLLRDAQSKSHETHH